MNAEKTVIGSETETKRALGSEDETPSAVGDKDQERERDGSAEDKASGVGEKDSNGNGDGEEDADKEIEAAAAPGFFAWLSPALRNKRLLKTWVRCILALAGAVVLLVDNASLRTMGQAGFFAALVAVLLPPSLALSVFILASFTLLFGMLLGWAWGAAMMAAGHAVRDKALLAARLAAAQKGLVPGVSPTLQLQSLIFHGAFLDPRTSAAYGALFFLGAFALGALRARVPRLALMGIFGTIVVDVFATTGVLLPTPSYTLAKTFLIPACYYLAVALATLVLVFPESLNGGWLTTLDGAYFGSTLSILSLQNTALGTRPSDHAAWGKVGGKIASARLALGGALAGLAGQLALMDLELSRGRLGPTDLKRLAPEIRALGVRGSGLLAFHAAVENVNNEDAREEEAAAKASAANSNINSNVNSNANLNDAHARANGYTSALHTRFTRRRQIVRAREARHGHTLDTLVPILASASAPLRAAAESGLLALQVWFRGCNTARWALKHPSTEEVEKRQKALVEARDALMGKLEAWRGVERVRLIEPFEKFFDPETGRLAERIGRGAGGVREDPEMFAVRSLFICFVFCDTLDAFAARLHRVLAIVVDLDARRPAPRLWLPPGFGKLGRKILSREPATVAQQPLAMGTSNDPTRFDADGAGTETVDGDDGQGVGKEEEEVSARPRNPDALPPTSALGRFSVALGGSLRFFKSPEGIFALRHAVISLALWIPSVVPRTAWFYYANKGLWALIMGQMGLATFAGDQLFGVATRIVGTAIGLLNGMVVWYIAAPGKADGNAYAVVVVTTVFTAPYIFARIAAPPMQMMFWTMIGVTTVFVVGYSWLDTHFPLVSNSGVGIALGWKRALLVMIGFTAGGILMMFPRPTSARILVRRTLAATLREQGSIFGQEVEAFLAEEARARSGQYERETIDWVDQQTGEDAPPVSPKERRIRKVAQRVLVVFERLQGLAPSLKTSRWEPQVQGLWPHEQYELLHAKETRLITTLALLAGAFSKLDTKWCSILVHRTPFLNPNLLSDVFATIDILANALEAGHPLPASLPCLRERLVYHETLIRSISRTARAPPAAPPIPQDDDSDDDADSETHAEFVAGKVEGASIGFEELSLSVLMDEQLPTHSTGEFSIPHPPVIALGNFLGLIDEIGAIVRELCGETTFRGFDALHHEFLGREEAALGTFGRRPL
ncbi:hypothetical protein DFH06DRAFT_1472122 [Mycena polygramma]|nr:hypothetical protein DFH06DRAFT_1472122 [Mycena polygramma]